jgi:hypothetical protein
MGYSGRYHAASLAAVFLALAVGILIGVGFGSDIVTGTAEDLERSLASDLDEARDRIGELEDELAAQADVTEALVPAVVGDRLRGREIALVALGGLDESLAADVRAALRGTGASLSEVAVVRQPPDSGVAAAAVRDGGARNEPRGAALDRAAFQAGRALARGGERFDRLREALFSRYSGEPGDVDGAVVVRQRPEDMSARDEADTDRLEQGLVQGLRSATPSGRAPIAVVGVEATDTEPSSIEFFADRGLATVDNVDQLPGRVSLVFALDGAEGNYGVKETADTLLPDLLSPPSLSFGTGTGGPGAE